MAQPRAASTSGAGGRAAGPPHPGPAWWATSSAPFCGGNGPAGGCPAGRVQSVVSQADRRPGRGDPRLSSQEEYWTIDAKPARRRAAAKVVAARQLLHGHGGKRWRLQAAKEAQLMPCWPPCKGREFLVGNGIKKGVRKEGPRSAVHHLHPPAGGFPHVWASRRGGP